MFLAAAGLAVCCFAILSDRVVAIQYALLEPHPMDDEDSKSGVRLPGDATRSEWDDENAPASRKNMPPLAGTPPSLPHDLGPESELEDPPQMDVGKAGAGFGAACGHSEGCSRTLGLACLKSERQGYRCGCAKKTPVFVNEGGIKKCVRAKSMYESCLTHLECSYQNPNLQCVDFLCYCPLPYVLTEARRCLAPSGLHNRMVFAIAPTVVLFAVLFVIGGAYTYKRVASGGDVWPSATSLYTLNSATERPSESMPHVSSAIRLGRKDGSGRRPRLSLQEQRAALREARKPPLHPPRYIRPRERSAQKSFSQDVRVMEIKEDSTLSSESSGFSSRRESPRSACASTSEASNGQLNLPVHEEASVHIIHNNPASRRASQELSTEVSGLRHSRKETDRRMSPTQLLRRILDEAEVKVNVLRSASSTFDNQGAQRPPLSKFLGNQCGSQPSVPAACKFQGWPKGDSSTEDSFMREIRCRVEASSQRPSVQGRAISADATFTKDRAVRLVKSFPDKIDESQQVYDVSSTGIEHTAALSAQKSVHEMERKTTVPVQKSAQEIEQKIVTANEIVSAAEQTEDSTVKSAIGSSKERMKKKIGDIDVSSNVENQEPHGISSGEPPILVKRVCSDSLPGTANQTAKKGTVPPPPVSSKEDPQQAFKSDFVHATTDDVKDKEKTRKNGGNMKKMPTSPKFVPTVLSDDSTAGSPAFKVVHRELIHQHAQKRAAAPSLEDASNKTIPGNRSPQPSGSTSNSTPVESVICASLTRTNFPPKGSAKESSSIRIPQEVTRNFSPPVSPRSHTTAAQESDVLCAAVHETANSVVKGKSSNETGSEGGLLRHKLKDSASPGSLNSMTIAVEESRPWHVRNLLQPDRASDDGKRDVKRATPKQQVWFGRSSDNVITNGRKQPPKLHAWENNFSEKSCDESRLRGHVPPISPKNSGPQQPIFLSQELEIASGAADASLEQAFLCQRIENNWNLTSSEAVLGSLDVESSETSLGGLRATLKKSVDVTRHMLASSDTTALAVPALKGKKTKASERRKRVNFQEKPFAEVLAEIEDDYMEPEKGDNVEGDKEESTNSDTAAEQSTESSRSEDQERSDDSFSNSCLGTASRNVIREADGKKENKGQPLATLAQNLGGQPFGRQTAVQADARFQHVREDTSFAERCSPKELVKHNTDLSPRPSREAISKETLVSHPFCSSYEGPLPSSASTTLSFLSSESSASTAYRLTDLTSLHTLADLAAPLQETGDGKSRTAATNLPSTPKLESRALQGLHRSQRESVPLHQEGEQQWMGHPMLPSPRAPSAEDRSACSSRRLSTLKQAKRQDSREDRRSSRPPKRPNTGERQRVGRFAAKERRWDGDIIQVIMMDNKHYLHERSTASPRPLSASMAAVPPLDETRYIAQQIELMHAIDKDVARTSPSLELRLATGVDRNRAVTVLEETAITTAHSRDLSACNGMQALAGPRDTGLEQQVPLSPSTRISQESLPEGYSGLRCATTSPGPLAATYHSTLGPSGEQPNLETFAEAVCEIELQHPQAVSDAVGSKVLERVTGDVLSGDALELVKSPVQIGVIEDSMDHFIPSLTSELGGESRLTPTWPQWDAPERDLLEFVKMQSAAVGTPETSLRTIGLPSAEGLLMSDTSTLASRVDAAASSSVGCSVVLEPSTSALSHARSGSSKSVRSKRRSAKVPEGPCFESIYNAILQPGPSLELSLSIPSLGSRDFKGPFGARERTSVSVSQCSAVPSLADDLRDGEVVAIVATTSSSVGLAPPLTVPQPSEGGSHHGLVPVTTDAAAVFREGARKGDDEMKKHTPRPNGEAPPSYYGGRGASQSQNSGVLPQGDMVVDNIQDDASFEEDGRSSFFSFEESASETSLLPDAVNLDWSTSSAASQSRGDRG